MTNRLALHEELKRFMSNVYFQPPENLTMVYPCIVYSKLDKYREFSNDGMYIKKQQYQIMLIEKHPDTGIADTIEESYQYCVITRTYTVENLSHTTLNLYY